MGRFVKNTMFRSGSYSIDLPATSNSFRPNVTGYTAATALRYSTTSNALEFFNHSANTYSTLSTVGTGSALVTKDTFTGSTGISQFGAMSFSIGAGHEANVLVHVAGVYQIPGTNYVFGGNTTISFLSAPSDSSTITLIHGYNSTTPA
jgi:hypothetical protein|tara:strand:- start:1052 stop:1495 length:444 start_codon:yes stop_codon:yes gene_type:complete